MQVAGAKGFLDVRSSYKTIGLWVILIALFVASTTSSPDRREVEEPTFTALLTKIDEKKVRLVAVKGNTYSGAFDGHATRSSAPPARPPTPPMLEQLRDAGVDVKYEKEEQNSLWLTILGQWMPVVFLFLFFIFFMRQLQGTGGKAMTFGKSKAKLLIGEPQQGHLRRRGRHRRVQGRARGDHRLPQGPEEVHQARAAASPRAC